MEIKQSLESVRDFTLDCVNAGRVMLAGLIEKADTKLSDICNDPDDEYPLQD